MKKLALLLISFFVLTAESKNVGLGVVLGSEGPITAKFFLSPSKSIQTHFGSNDGMIEFYADYLWEKQKAFQVEGQTLNFYAGVGAAIVGDEENKNGRKEKDTYIGARVPLGLNFRILENQLELFTEIAPGILVSPETETFVSFGLGARWFF